VENRTFFNSSPIAGLGLRIRGQNLIQLPQISKAPKTRAPERDASGAARLLAADGPPNREPLAVR
jgi:hypothetical protein